MLSKCKFIEPDAQCFEEFMATKFWWNGHIPVIGLGFSRKRAGEFLEAGLRFMGDIWLGRDVCFFTTKETQARFGLRETKFGA